MSLTHISDIKPRLRKPSEEKRDRAEQIATLERMLRNGNLVPSERKRLSQRLEEMRRA